MSTDKESPMRSVGRNASGDPNWRPRIMFVDDDDALLVGLRRTLRSMSEKWEMDFISSSHEAVNHLRQGHYDVLVADLHMPWPPGLEIVKAQNVNSPGTRCIILSGNADVQAVTEIANAAQVSRFLAKPCEPKQLIATIGLALKRTDANRI